MDKVKPWEKFCEYLWLETSEDKPRDLIYLLSELPLHFLPQALNEVFAKTTLDIIIADAEDIHKPYVYEVLTSVISLLGDRQVANIFGSLIGEKGYLSLLRVVDDLSLFHKDLKDALCLGLARKRDFFVLNMLIDKDFPFSFKAISNLISMGNPMVVHKLTYNETYQNMGFTRERIFPWFDPHKEKQITNLLQKPRTLPQWKEVINYITSLLLPSHFCKILSQIYDNALPIFEEKSRLTETLLISAVRTGNLDLVIYMTEQGFLEGGDWTCVGIEIAKNGNYIFMHWYLSHGFLLLPEAIKQIVINGYLDFLDFIYKNHPESVCLPMLFNKHIIQCAIEHDVFCILKWAVSKASKAKIYWCVDTCKNLALEFGRKLIYKWLNRAFPC